MRAVVTTDTDIVVPASPGCGTCPGPGERATAARRRRATMKLRRCIVVSLLLMAAPSCRDRGAGADRAAAPEPAQAEQSRPSAALPEQAAPAAAVEQA